MQLPSGRLTIWIVAVTSGLWVLMALSGWLQVASYVGGFLPARVSGLGDVPGALPTWLTPLSATLIHADILHLGFNMLMLAFCGRFVESAVGGWLLAVLYVIGAYAAAIAQYFADPTSVVPMIGASGAISAVVGAYAMQFSEQKVRRIGPFSPHAVRILWLAIAWIGVQTLLGLATFGTMTRIAIAAHIGGFVAGLFLARPLLLWRYRRA